MCTLDLLEGTKLEDMEVAGGSPQYKRGLWTEEEDKILMEYVEVHGKGQWNRIAKKTGLKRCGKSCRLRWMNYLSPNVKRGNFTEEEDDLIIRLHKLLGNRWSLIAGRVPGRTDNQVKNYWNTHLSKRNGCIKKRRRKEESFTTNPETSKSVVSSKDSEAMTAASLTVVENAELETTATATDNDPIVDALSAFPQKAYTFLADGDIYGSSVSWRDQVDEQMSSFVQFSDEFLQFDFGWSSVFSD